MSDDPAEPGPSSRPFLDRLIQAFGAEPQHQDDLLEILRDAGKRQLIDSESLTMIEGVFEVAKVKVRDVMIPRVQMVFVSIDDPLDKIVRIISESGHSRFPVIGDSRDEVVGILLAKDLLRFVAKSAHEEFNLSSILHRTVVTPESKRLNVLLREFRDNRNHMAIVVDEYGGVAGLVTIEDVLETIVGDIDDEHDRDEELNIRPIDEHTFSVKAFTPIEEFNDQFNCAFPDDEYDTIGGLVIQRFGHLPEVGESVELAPFTFRVESGDSRRIHTMHVHLNTAE